MNLLLPHLTKSSPTLSRGFFACIGSSRQYIPINHSGPLLRANLLKAIRSKNNVAQNHTLRDIPLTPLNKTLSFQPNIVDKRFHANSRAKDGFFPEITSKSVSYWLLGSAASVFGIVVLGGLTRLTESGLVKYSC